jgi:xanthine dehydrogenase molybdopterin-binding subunit B
MTHGFFIWGNFSAMVSIYAQDGTVAVSHGGIEMGQGINTKVSLFAVDGGNVITVKLACVVTE